MIITWPDLLTLEPRLLPIAEEAASYHLGPRFADFCANEIWHGYGPGEGRSLKDKVELLVGWLRPDRHEVLSTSEAYELATLVLYEALPPCGAECGCVRVEK